MYISKGVFATFSNIIFLLSIQLEFYIQFYTDITFLFRKIQSITRFYFSFNYTVGNYLLKEYKFIEDVQNP